MKFLKEKLTGKLKDKIVNKILIAVLTAAIAALGFSEEVAKLAGVEGASIISTLLF